ncbi:MAG: NUDIX hydrolase [Bacteroidales bacterium]|nr:NUDIX hydrolase [Bacteroidales bacterium]
MYSYRYPRPSVTADIAILTSHGDEVLLIRRGNDPYKGMWALPGGFFDMEDDDIACTARRELQEETGLSDIPLFEVCTASRRNRDPRGRTISVIFTAKVDPSQVKPHAGDDAAEAAWFPINALPPMAFDHEEIMQKVCHFYLKQQ